MDLTAKYHLQREKAFAMTLAEGQHFTNITLKSKRGLDLSLWVLASYFASVELFTFYFLQMRHTYL